MRKLWIILGAFGVLCAGAAVAGPPVARSVAPQFFVARAAYNTAAEFMPMIETFVLLAPNVQNDPLRVEFSSNIGSIGGAIGEYVPPEVRPILPMVSIRGFSRLDGSRDNYNMQLSVQMVATNLVSANFYLSKDRIAFGVPALFDYYITADPRRLGSELLASPIGPMMPFSIIDELFYEIYTDIFFNQFNRFEEINIAEYRENLTERLMELIEQMEFEYLGRGGFGRDGLGVGRDGPGIGRDGLGLGLGRDGYEIYYITVPAEDISATVYIDGNRLVGIDFKNIQLRSPQAGTIEINTEYEIYGRLEFTDTGGNQGNQSHQSGQGSQGNQGNQGNQSNQGSPSHQSRQIVSFDFSTPYVAADGEMHLFPQAWRIDANIGRLLLTLPEIELSMSAMLSVMPDTEPIIFDYGSAKLLTDLNLFDLLAIYASIGDSPIGRILNDF